jgi:hypothetical protein
MAQPKVSNPYRKQRTAHQRQSGTYVPKKLPRRSGAAPVKSRRTK